jgi:hypothetical protein
MSARIFIDWLTITIDRFSAVIAATAITARP